jgi:histidine triad (HIT) family protein
LNFLFSGEIPASVVHEDADTIAFMDIGSVNPGHVLVAAKQHAENIYALDEATGAAVGRTVVRVARAIGEAFTPEGLSQYQANGNLAGQTVVPLPRASRAAPPGRRDEDRLAAA